jgi:hypothetical protein
MKKNIIKGISLGVVVGIIDVIPMLMQSLTWDANISAFLMWVAIGFILSITELKMNTILKGIMISFLVLLRCNPDWLERTRITCAYHNHDNNIRWRTWLLNPPKKG